MKNKSASQSDHITATDVVSTLVCKGGFQEKGGVCVCYMCVYVLAYVYVCMCVSGSRQRRTHAGHWDWHGFVGWEESVVVGRPVFIHSQTIAHT